MLITSSKNSIFITVGIFSLILGVLIYLVFRENSYITQFLMPQISLLDWAKKFRCLDNNFIKYYFPDYLWGLSLACWLHIIFKPKMVGSAVCTASIFVFGAGYELLQHIDFVTGTGDFIDICLYLSAGITANILNLKGLYKK